jgi:hypothetical protein
MGPLGEQCVPCRKARCQLSSSSLHAEIASLSADRIRAAMTADDMARIQAEIMAQVKAASNPRFIAPALANHPVDAHPDAAKCATGRLAQLQTGR